MGSNLVKATVIINIGKIDNGIELINSSVYSNTNVILVILPESTTVSELKSHMDYYKNNDLIDEIILLGEASDLLMDNKKVLKLKK